MNAHPAAADRHYRQGNELRRQGRFDEAMNHYMEALAHDPGSPAREALLLLEDIMQYRCTDLYNP